MDHSLLVPSTPQELLHDCRICEIAGRDLGNEPALSHDMDPVGDPADELEILLDQAAARDPAGRAGSRTRQPGGPPRPCHEKGPVGFRDRAARSHKSCDREGALVELRIESETMIRACRLQSATLKRVTRCRYR